MNPPPNPNADAARQDIAAYNAPILHNPLPTEPHFVYYLTWPASQPIVCCFDGQYRRNKHDEIEAWYTRDQLRFALDAMQAAKK